MELNLDLWVRYQLYISSNFANVLSWPRLITNNNQEVDDQRFAQKTESEKE